MITWKSWEWYAWYAAVPKTVVNVWERILRNFKPIIQKTLLPFTTSDLFDNCTQVIWQTTKPNTCELKLLSIIKHVWCMRFLKRYHKRSPHLYWDRVQPRRNLRALFSFSVRRQPQGASWAISPTSWNVKCLHETLLLARIPDVSYKPHIPRKMRVN